MLKPLNDNVVLKKEEKIQETKSGIILSQKKEETEYAVVLAVGEGYRDEKGNLNPINLTVGDKVIYRSYSPTTIKLDGVEYLIVSAKDILAIVE